MATSEPQGIPLPLYAAVNAAVAEGFALSEVLALEGIASDVWKASDLAWKKYLVAEKADFSRYEVELAGAEDWLSREVIPLASDPAAWLAFLDLYATHAAPFDLLRGFDLGLNDASRLRRIWERRIAEDPEVQKRMTELKKNSLAPLPRLTVKPRVLKRWRGVARSAPSNAPAGETKSTPFAAIAAIAAPQRGMSTGDLGLDLYAVQCAHFEFHPTDTESLRRFGITSEEQRLAMSARWEKEFQRDPTLKRDFRLLVEHEKRRLSARDKTRDALPEPAQTASPREPSGIIPAPLFNAPVFTAAPKIKPAALLQGTSLALDVPRGAVTPFVAVAKIDPPKEASSPTPELTLEQHASLSVELALSPQKTEEILARYRLTQASKAAMDDHYRARIASAPELRDVWQRAYATYHAWLAKGSR